MTVPRIAHVATVDLSLRFLLLPQLLALRDAGFEVTTISAPGPWVPEIEAAGLRHIVWPHATRAWDPRSDVLAFRELVAISRHERFDLVHTHNPKPGLLGRVAARTAGVPCVMNTVHGLYATPEDRLRRKGPVLAVEWFASRFSDLELYQSAEDLAWARRMRVTDRARSLHLSNGVDISGFTPNLAEEERVRKLRADLGIGEDEIVIGTVGRMVQEKGYSELFEAARTVRARFPRARFIAVGQSDPDKSDAVTPEQIELARDDFIFTGWREDVADLMALMDIFVLPSWREGMPRSAIEAAASGLPQVLTDIRGCREVIRDGVDGLLVPVRDPISLADAIGRLLEDPTLRREMGKATRERAMTLFDEHRVATTVVGATTYLLGMVGKTPVRGHAEIRIRPAIERDAATMARLHRVAMPTAFLPSLGRGFLTRLYRAIALDADGVALVAEDQGALVGFATAVPSVAAFYRRFARRQGVAAGFSAAPHLLRPSAIRHALETLRYPSGTDDLPDAELLSIAVEGMCRSRGVGAALMSEIAQMLGDRGVREFKAVVGADNSEANRFYERLSFHAARQTAVHRGVQSNVWVMSCPP